jgi:EAL domain-containing protein (putative c-di-GMP-specific phosphodiesterase class I)
VLDGFQDIDEVLDVTSHALSRLAMPVTAGGRSLQVGASAGIALSSDSAAVSRPEELMQQAGVAVAHAKRTEPGQGLMFQESMKDQARRPFDLTVDLQTATGHGQIQVAYQPIVVLGTMELAGFEALARWDHPERGRIPPANFIPVAEDTGDIVALGRHVLESACTQMAEWTDDPTRPLRIGVNVSPRQLADDGIVADVRRALVASGLAAEQLVLEITESALHHDIASVQARLQELRDLGVRIAMDDFGTGFSSLAYLRRLPLDIVKIDKSFIDDRTATGPQLLEAVIHIGSQLGLDTVAEGIEDPDQLESARAAGCTFGQGFLFARPLDAAAATELVTERRAAAVG